MRRASDQRIHYRDLTDALDPASYTIAYLRTVRIPSSASQLNGDMFDRILNYFHQGNISQDRQRFIVTLLGEVHAESAFSFLVETLKHDHLTVALQPVL